MGSVNQNILIPRMNDYMKHQRLPLQVNETGICAGLSNVYAKYKLEGRENDFLEMLSKITSNDLTQFDDHFNHFITEVVLSFSPSDFDPSLAQHDGMSILKINHQSLVPSFQLVLTAKKEDWSDIMSSLNFMPDEVIRIDEEKHSITISRDNQGHYRVYDPNYSSGIKIFSSVQELVEELYENVFPWSGRDLTLTLETYQITPRPTLDRDLRSIYQKYLKKTNQQKTLQEIIPLKNQALLTLFLKINGKPTELSALFELCRHALVHHNLKAFSYFSTSLIPELDAKKIASLIMLSIISGNLNAFQQLMLIPRVKGIFSQLDPVILLHSAIKRSNEVKMIKELINLYDPKDESRFVTKLLLKKAPLNAIEQAIHANAHLALKQLISYLDNDNHKIPEEEYLRYLSQAIKKNHIYCVELLLQKISKESLKTLSFSLSRAEKTNLSILKILQKHGVVWPEEIQNIMSKKEHESSGIMAFWGLSLRKFIYFIQDLLLQKKDIHFGRSLTLFQPSEQTSTADISRPSPYKN